MRLCTNKHWELTLACDRCISIDSAANISGVHQNFCLSPKQHVRNFEHHYYMLPSYTGIACVSECTQNNRVGKLRLSAKQQVDTQRILHRASAPTHKYKYMYTRHKHISLIKRTRIQQNSVLRFYSTFLLYKQAA